MNHNTRGVLTLKKKIHRLIGPYLKEQRLRLKYSRKEVAKTLECTEQFILNFEHGTCSPPGPMLKALIELYRLDSNEVLEILFRESIQEWCAIVPPKVVNAFAQKLKISCK